MLSVVGWKRRSCLLLVVACILLFSLGTTSMNWVKYVSLRSTFAYDLGFYHNSAFNYARGRTITYILNEAHFWRASVAGGQGASGLARHWHDYNGPSVFRSALFSPMQVFLLPQLYRLWPSIVTLFFLQSLIIGLGALPLLWFGTERTGAPWVGLILALSYLLHPAVLHMGFNDFREIALGLSLALFALYFHARRQPIPFGVAALLMLACRQEYVFLLALFGLINWRLAPSREGRLRWALGPLLLALLWAGLTNAYYLYFYDRLWPLRTYAGASRPLGTLLLSLLERLPIFLRIMLLPAVGGLLVPEAFVAALPFVAGALDVLWTAFPHHHLQHLSPALAAVFWAFAGALVRLWPWLAQRRERVAWTRAILLAAALLSFAQFGWGAAQAYLVGGVPRYAALARLDASLPADATVMVPKDLLARFSAHTRVFTHESLPLGMNSPISVSKLKTILIELISVCDLVALEFPRDFRSGLEFLVLESGRYLPAQRIDHYYIFVAKDGAPRPSDPDARLQAILGWDQMSQTQRRWADLRVGQ